MSGTPTVAGQYFTSMSASNGDGQGRHPGRDVHDRRRRADSGRTHEPFWLSPRPVGASFSFTLTATNNPTSFFSATNLPAGLTLNTSTGVISGAATTAGIYSVPIEEINSFGQSLPRTLAIMVGDYSSITSAATASAPAGGTFSFALSASNSPLSYTVSGLPAGLAPTIPRRA